MYEPIALILRNFLFHLHAACCMYVTCLHILFYEDGIAIWALLVLCQTNVSAESSVSSMAACVCSFLLSKNGLRYLLYPFISRWMVGGRISPSFTSALSIELSNNLRTKTERETRENQIWWIFLVLFSLCVCQAGALTTTALHLHRRLSSSANLTNHADRKKRLYWDLLGIKKMGGGRTKDD